jgi:hypothetical protein
MIGLGVSLAPCHPLLAATQKEVAPVVCGKG